jgi:hypothetical protein
MTAMVPRVVTVSTCVLLVVASLIWIRSFFMDPDLDPTFTYLVPRLLVSDFFLAMPTGTVPTCWLAV